MRKDLFQRNNGIFVEKNVFDKSQVHTMYDFLIKNDKLFDDPYFTEGQQIKEFIGCTIPFKRLNADSEKKYQIKQFLNIVRFFAQNVIHNKTGQLHIPDNTELTKWKTGKEMSIHSDNSWPDGNQLNHPTSFRTWSGIFYINDNYEGGEIEFPVKDFTYKPESNSLVVFPSTHEYLHGVKKITKGTRYTVAIWFTQNFAHIEI
jgi:hypothetical protein